MEVEVDSNSDVEDLFLTQNRFSQGKENEEEKDLDDFQFRFGEPLTTEDLDEKCKIQVPNATRAKNNWAFTTFTRWQEERRQRRISANISLPKESLFVPLDEMPTFALNAALKFFLFEARKQDGHKYTADSIHGLLSAIQSGLRMKGSTLNIFEDGEFEETRNALDSVMRERSREGLGASARKATEVISFNEEEELWKKKLLGEETPQQLLDTILYLTGLHFALRGGREHRALRLFRSAQITGPHTDHRGKRYLLYTEDASKNNAGGLKEKNLVPKQVRAYEDENPDRCYVRLFQKYRSLCTGKDTDIFYFAPVKKPKDCKWYTENAVGHNTLSATVKRLCETAGIDGRKTNHSLRATAATRLYQAHVDEQIICGVTVPGEVDMAAIKAVIIVGSVVMAIFILIAVYCFLRRRQRKEPPYQTQVDVVLDPIDKGESVTRLGNDIESDTAFREDISVPLETTPDIE